MSDGEGHKSRSRPYLTRHLEDMDQGVDTSDSLYELPTFQVDVENLGIVEPRPVSEDAGQPMIPDDSFFDVHRLAQIPTAIMALTIDTW